MQKPQHESLPIYPNQCQTTKDQQTVCINVYKMRNPWLWLFEKKKKKKKEQKPRRTGKMHSKVNKKEPIYILKIKEKK